MAWFYGRTLIFSLFVYRPEIKRFSASGTSLLDFNGHVKKSNRLKDTFSVVFNQEIASIACALCQ